MNHESVSRARSRMLISMHVLRMASRTMTAELELSLRFSTLDECRLHPHLQAARERELREKLERLLRDWDWGESILYGLDENGNKIPMRGGTECAKELRALLASHWPAQKPHTEQRLEQEKGR